MKRKPLYLLVLTALFAALTAALTSWHILPQPHGGYAHVGDSVIYLAACFLPAPYAMAAGALGGGLADLLGGAPLWIPATVLLKSLTALCFTAKKEKLLCPRNVLGLLAAAVINTGGYYLYVRLLYGGWAALLDALIAGLIQSGGSAVVFVCAALALDRLHAKDKLLKWSK